MHDTPNNTIKHVDYLDGFQYAGEKLQFFPTSEGYVSATQDGISIGNPDLYIFNYVYNYTDHLGNIRLSYTKDPVSNELKIMEENHYYPFGLKHDVYATPKQKYELVDNMENTARPTYVLKTDYQYKYNGKEWQDELNLNLYDYGARNYDAALGRWMNIDPLAEDYLNLTPYNYTANNPVFFIDPDGMRIVGNLEIVQNVKNVLNGAVSDIKDMIKNGSVSEEIGNKLISANEKALTEIGALEKSDQVYNVFTDSNLPIGEGGTYYNMNSKEVMIALGSKSATSTIVHEFTHAYQFEKGKISFLANGGAGSLYDLGDEVEAYDRASILMGTIKSHTLNDIIQIGKKMTPPAYQNLPMEERSLNNSKYGKSLREKTIEAGKNGQPVSEVYINWEKDYKKGEKKRNK